MEVAATEQASFCHCRACQRASGSPMMAWATASAAHVTLRGPSTEWSGEPAGPHSTRVFCPRCGSTVAARSHDGAHVSVPITVLDDPDALEPVVHLEVVQQRPWMRYWDGLPRVESSPAPEPLARSWRTVRDPSVTRASELTLRKVVDENRMAVLTLTVGGPQWRFVAPNVLSLLEHAYTTYETWLRAIYAGEVPVGLVLVDFPTQKDADEIGMDVAGRPFLWRFMIDHEYQGLGFGRRALEATLAAMHARDPAPDAMFLGCVPGVGSPQSFYERLGFVQVGMLDERELLMRRPFASSPEQGAQK